MRRVLTLIFALIVSITFLSGEKYWFKSQFNTGVYGNCGPTCVAMLIYYSTNIDVSVERVRDQIGQTGSMMFDGKLDGSTSFEELEGAMKYFGVPFVDVDYGNIHTSQIDMFLNQGLKVLVLVDLDNIPVKANRGMGYGGHYFIISGMDDKGNYEVQDPFNGSDVLFPKRIVTVAMMETRIALIWQGYYDPHNARSIGYSTGK